MRASLTEIRGLVAQQIAQVGDLRRREQLQSLLTEPELRSFNWDYSAHDQRLDGWVVGGSPDRSILLVYAEEGFGPSEPWGMVIAEDDSFGMDSQWHVGLEHAAICAGLLDAPPRYEVP